MIAACLAKEPTQRPPSGADAVRLLDLSMHALVPFIPREEIKVESLRLDLAPVIRASEEPQTAEAIDLPAEVEPVRVWRSAKVLPPERLTGFQSFLFAMRDEALLWVRRVVYLLTIIGVFIGVFYLVQGWNRISAQSEPIMIQMPAISAQGLPVPAPGQTVHVEVRYSQPPGPPPGWAPPMPPPPPPAGFPGPGGPGGPPPPRMR
jgi:hypothetical protein